MSSSFIMAELEPEPGCACVLSPFSCVRLFVTLWTVARQGPLSIGFSRQEYWSALQCPPSGDLSHPGLEPVSVCCIGRQILYHYCHLGSPEPNEPSSVSAQCSFYNSFSPLLFIYLFFSKIEEVLMNVYT